MAFLPSTTLPRPALRKPRCTHRRPTSMTIAQTSRQSLAPRVDFPILNQTINDSQLIYLDSAATSQKPLAVLDALQTYYKTHNSNVHRGAHFLATAATNALERTRDQLAEFLHAPSRDEVVFTRNATESINLVATSWGGMNLKKGDQIVVSVMEHHANLVPWQLAAERVGAEVVAVALSETEGYDVGILEERLKSGRVKMVACSHVSNVLGCVNPVGRIVEMAHEAGAVVLVDACQSVPHMDVDVRELGCDFLVASSHKMLGPTGVGFLWGRRELLEEMPPYMGGGEMIGEVFLERSTFAELPHKFEAGTPAIGEIVGLGAALDYLTGLGMGEVGRFEGEIGRYLYERLREFKEVRIYGPGERRVGLCAFNVDGVHASDLATMLDLEGVAVRAGHHCAQPLHRALGVSGSVRASLYVYNCFEEVDQFVEKLASSVELLGGSLTTR